MQRPHARDTTHMDRNHLPYNVIILGEILSNAEKFFLIDRQYFFYFLETKLPTVELIMKSKDDKHDLHNNS